MPAKKHTPAPPATTASTRLPVDAPVLPPAAVTVLAVLDAENPTTNAEAVERTGLARSTVTKALSTLLDAGLATRQDGGHDGTLRIPDRWYATPWKTDLTADGGGQDAEHRDDQTPAPKAEPADDDADAASALPPAAHKILPLLDTENPTTGTEMAERTGLGRSTANKALTALADAGLAVRQDGGLESGRPVAACWFAAPGPSDPDADQTRPHQETDDATAENGAEPHDDTAEHQRPEPQTAGAGGGPDEATADCGPDDEAPYDTSGPEEDATVAEVAEPNHDDGTGSAPAPETGASESERAQDQTRPSVRAESAQRDGAASAAETTGTEPAVARLGKGELRAQVEAHLREHPDQTWTPTAISKILNRSAGAINNACVKLSESGAVTAHTDKPVRFQWRSEQDPTAV